MLKEIKKINIIRTDSEIEALLLESNLIKKHQPNYNIMLRDDKRYVYIKISTENEFPRVFTTRNLDKQGLFFGPFVSTEAVKETLKTIRKIWPYRTCKNLPKKACLYYSIGKCPGMCEKRISIKEYKNIINQIISFLKGEKKEVVREIKKEIKLLEKNNPSNPNPIELLKYQLINIEKTLATNNILSLIDKYAADVVELAKILGLPKVPQRIEGYDISNIYGQEATGSMVVFSDGEANKNEYRKFKIKTGQGESNDTKMLKEILERRFNNDWPLPDLIVIDGAKAQVNAANMILRNRKLDILIIGLSKGKGLRSSLAPDKIYFTGEKKPLQLPIASPALHILKRVRDESHRFAINYHRKLKRKSIFK
jgi:excinuclease ABC subunit C